MSNLARKDLGMVKPTFGYARIATQCLSANTLEKAMENISALSKISPMAETANASKQTIMACTDTTKPLQKIIGPTAPKSKAKKGLTLDL